MGAEPRGNARAAWAAWAGLALSVSPAPLWVATVDVPALRASAAPSWIALALGLVLGFVALRFSPRRWVRALFALDVVLAAGFAALLLVVARLPSSTAESLERAPQASFVDSRGAAVVLADELARGAVHLVFFRGPW